MSGLHKGEGVKNGNLSLLYANILHGCPLRPCLTHTLDQIGRLELSLAHVNRATQGSQSFLDRSNFNNSSY